MHPARLRALRRRQMQSLRNVQGLRGRGNLGFKLNDAAAVSAAENAGKGDPSTGYLKYRDSYTGRVAHDLNSNGRSNDRESEQLIRLIERVKSTPQVRYVRA